MCSLIPQRVADKPNSGLRVGECVTRRAALVIECAHTLIPRLSLSGWLRVPRLSHLEGVNALCEPGCARRPRLLDAGPDLMPCRVEHARTQRARCDVAGPSRH